MRSSKATMGLLMALVAGITGASSACSDDASTTTSGTASAASSGSGGGASWVGGACGTCIEDACASWISACESDPECATWLTCDRACPPAAPDGDADPTCEAACPLPGGSVGQKAVDDLLFCKQKGDGLTCTTCGWTAGECALLEQTCPDTTNDNPCYECEDDKCCETYAAYAANPEAVALKACFLEQCDLDDDECWYQCLFAHPDGVADWGAREACFTVHCGDPSACGNEPKSECQACVDANCGCLGAACFEDAECYMLAMCIGRDACVDQACFDDCFAEYPGAVETFEAYGTCGFHECQDLCAL